MRSWRKLFVFSSVYLTGSGSGFPAADSGLFRRFEALTQKIPPVGRDFCLYSAQCVDGVQVCGLGGGKQAEDHTDEGGEYHGDDDCRGTDGHGNLHQAGDQLRQANACENADDTADAGEHGRFRQELQ